MPLSSSPRFFALTAERLEAISSHGLTLADLKVWAYVELQAKPQRPVPFRLEAVATALHLGVNTVRRAIRRLVGFGLVLGRLEGNRYHLAPATSALGKQASKSTNLAVSSQGSTLPNRVEPSTSSTASNLPPMGGSQAENLPNRVEPKGQDAVVPPSDGQPPKGLSPEGVKLKPFACALTGELVDAWGIYPGVARQLVATHGEARVREVISWGQHLKAIGKLRSRGWVYQALVRGWGVPDGFQKAREGARVGIAPKPPARPAQQPQADEPLDIEDRKATLTRMLAQPFAASNRLAVKLAGEWGISLDALNCQGSPLDGTAAG